MTTLVVKVANNYVLHSRSSIWPSSKWDSINMLFPHIKSYIKEQLQQLHKRDSSPEVQTPTYPPPLFRTISLSSYTLLHVSFFLWPSKPIFDPW
jgi:hypothetical protein